MSKVPSTVFESLFARGKFQYVSSEYQHADILAKSLAFDVLVIHRGFLMN